nr:MAG TPA: hypothetical protein [Bacteriophage sp.]
MKSKKLAQAGFVTGRLKARSFSLRHLMVM